MAYRSLIQCSASALFDVALRSTIDINDNRLEKYYEHVLKVQYFLTCSSFSQLSFILTQD